MKKNSSKIYEYNEYTIAYNNKNGYIVANDMDFYSLNKDDFYKNFYKNIDKSNFKKIKVIKDNIFIPVVMLITIIGALIYYISNAKYVILDKNFIIATIILLINIPIHEFGHVLFLKLFYRKSKIKIGFTFIFIYPAFYVDTSYSYLLPKWKRTAIHLGGNFFNSIFLILALFLFPSLKNVLYILFSNILINLLPIVKSDGYYALYTMLDKVNYDKGRKKKKYREFL